MVLALLGLVALTALMLWGRFLFRRPRSPRPLRVERAGGAAILRLPAGRNALLGGLALAPAALLGALAVAAARASSSGPAGLALTAALALAGLAVSGYFFAAEARQRVRVDDFAIERVGVFTRRRVPWTDVTRIASNPVNRWFFLTAKGGARLWVPEALVGIGDFAETALRRLPPGVLSASPEAREALEDLAAAPRGGIPRSDASGPAAR